MDAQSDLITWGREGPPQQPLTLVAGPVSVELDGVELNRLRVGETELLRSVYVAVRDRDWGTVAPIVVRRAVEQKERSFQVHFEVHNVSTEIDFAWSGDIIGDEYGSIIFRMDGRARRDFFRNRIGFCLLHGMDMAGQGVIVKTASGIVQTSFPREISPHQPFKDVTGFSHRLPNGISADIGLTGDVFETEDQRNWTDASFKTFCTPLERPYPVQLRAGEAVAQSVTVAISSPVPERIEESESQLEDGVVQIGGGTRARVPRLGLTLAAGRQPDAGEVARLSQLDLAHLRVVVDLRAESWREALDLGARACRALSCSIELEVITESGDEVLEDRMMALAASIDEVDIASVLVFSGSLHVTTEEVLLSASRALRSATKSVRLGGGSRAYFAEFNRAKLPVGGMEIATYGISPQVHAFDSVSIRETLKAQAVTASCARTQTGGMPLTVGPITWLPRFNPNAADSGGVEVEEEALADTRQASLFAAAWTLGSIAWMATERVEALTYFETSGPRGVMDTMGEDKRHPVVLSEDSRYPVWHLLEALGGTAGGQLATVEGSWPEEMPVHAAWSEDNRLTTFVANLSSFPKTARLVLPRLVGFRVRILDAQSFADGQAFGWRTVQESPEESEFEFSTELPPFGILEVSGQAP